MEQFASNFPISNNISAANVEGFVRPTHNTDKSLARPEEGEPGGQAGGGRGVRSIGTDPSWLPGEQFADETAVVGLLRKPLWPPRGGAGTTHVLCWPRGCRLAGQGPGGSRGAPELTTSSQRQGLQDTATHLGSRLGQAALTEKFKDIQVFQVNRVQQGSLGKGSSPVGLWGHPSGGKPSPGTPRFICHSGKRSWPGNASGGSHCLLAMAAPPLRKMTRCSWLWAKRLLSRVRAGGEVSWLSVRFLIN